MIPMQLLMLEDEVGYQGEHHQRDALLDHLELHEVERTTVIHKAEAVGRHLTAILEEGDGPREGDDQKQRPVGRDARLLEAQMAIPGESHKHIAQNEQQNRIKTVYHNKELSKNGCKGTRKS